MTWGRSQTHSPQSRLLLSGVWCISTRQQELEMSESIIESCKEFFGPDVWESVMVVDSSKIQLIIEKSEVLVRSLDDFKACFVLFDSKFEEVVYKRGEEDGCHNIQEKHTVTLPPRFVITGDTTEILAYQAITPGVSIDEILKKHIDLEAVKRRILQARASNLCKHGSAQTRLPENTKQTPQLGKPLLRSQIRKDCSLLKKIDCFLMKITMTT